MLSNVHSQYKHFLFVCFHNCFCSPYIVVHNTWIFSSKDCKFKFCSIQILIQNTQITPIPMPNETASILIMSKVPYTQIWKKVVPLSAAGACGAGLEKSLSAIVIIIFGEVFLVPPSYGPVEPNIFSFLPIPVLFKIYFSSLTSFKYLMFLPLALF